MDYLGIHRPQSNELKQRTTSSRHLRPWIGSSVRFFLFGKSSTDTMTISPIDCRGNESFDKSFVDEMGVKGYITKALHQK